MKISRSYLIEVVLTATNQILFPKASFLDNKKIVAIEAFSASQITKSPDNLAVASQSDTATGFVVFENKGNAIIDHMPINSLIASLNNGVIKEFEPVEFNISKCRLIFPDTSVLTAGECVVFNFYYID